MSSYYKWQSHLLHCYNLEIIKANESKFCRLHPEIQIALANVVDLASLSLLTDKLMTTKQIASFSRVKFGEKGQKMGIISMSMWDYLIRGCYGGYAEH